MLMKFPEKEEMRSKNLYNVRDVRLHWQDDGDYLCCKVDRHTKSKKTLYCNFELFRVKERDVPVDVVEMKDNVMAFAWEPKGYRFAIIHGESAGSRPNVSLYSMKGAKKGDDVLHLKTLEKRPANTLFWSPTGNFILLGGLRQLNGLLDFYNVNELESFGSAEHYLCDNVEWSPCGRYVTTCVTQYRHTMENGYNIWSFQGRLINRQPLDKFFSFQWRPRPKSLLSSEAVAKVESNLKYYADKYSKDDYADTQADSAAKQAERAAAVVEFEEYRAGCKKIFNAQRQMRIDLRHGYISDDEDDFVEIVEEIDDQIEYKKEQVANLS